MTLALIVGVVGALGLTGGVAGSLLKALVIDEEAGTIASSSSSSWSGHIGLSSTSSSSSSSSGSSGGSGDSSSLLSSEASPSSSSSSSSSSSAPSETKVTYLLKTLTNKHSKSVKVHLLDIELSSIECFKTNIVTKNGSFGYGSSYMATVGTQFDTLKSNGEDIIGAMNGDDCFYSSSMKRKGYVIRNGVSYRSSVRSDASDYDDCVVYRDGTMSSFNENDYSCDEVIGAGAYHVFDFGPSLVQDGAINVSTTDEVDQSAGANPRSVLAYLGGLHYLFFVSEGRLNNSASDSLTLYEAASFLKDYGAKEAYNLDGGGSSTMIYEGSLKNATCNNSTSTQRKVSDCLYVIRS